MMQPPSLLLLLLPYSNPNLTPTHATQAPIHVGMEQEEPTVLPVASGTTDEAEVTASSCPDSLVPAVQPPHPSANRANPRKRGNDDASYVVPPPKTRVEGVSKSVAKQLWRQEMWKVKKAAKKEAKKAARLEARQQQQQEEGVGPDHRQERDIDPVLQQERREHRLAQRREAQEDFVRRCGEGARVVVDCGFDDQMTEKELKSLGQQVMYVYASNKRAPSPCFVHLTE